MSIPIEVMGEMVLAQLLERAAIPPAPIYRPAQVRTLLAISRNTFARLCDAWEPSEMPNRNPRGIQAVLLPSGHRRVSHAALAAWLARNQAYQRLYG